MRYRLQKLQGFHRLTQVLLALALSEKPMKTLQNQRLKKSGTRNGTRRFLQDRVYRTRKALIIAGHDVTIDAQRDANVRVPKTL